MLTSLWIRCDLIAHNTRLYKLSYFSLTGFPQLLCKYFQLVILIFNKSTKSYSSSGFFKNSNDFNFPVDNFKNTHTIIFSEDISRNNNVIFSFFHRLCGKSRGKVVYAYV